MSRVSSTRTDAGSHLVQLGRLLVILALVSSQMVMGPMPRAEAANANFLTVLSG